MFSTLRIDSLLYIIDKNSKKFSIVRNPKPSAPYPEYKTAIPLPTTPMFVDVEGEDGNNAVSFKKLPANLSSHEYNGVFVTESREAAQAELEAMKTKSHAVIESVPYHEEIVKFCDETIPLVNPSVAQDKERENRLHSLESRMGSMEAVLSEMNSTLKSLKNAQP